MNKLLGFYELKDSKLPTIPWKSYDENADFKSGCLWTVRTAVHRGEDLNLPRAVGVDAVDAKKFALEVSKQLRDNGLVIYYPYFLAEKSGTLNVFSDKIIIEAVNEDLWNLVTYSEKDVTIIIRGSDVEYVGDSEFLSKIEVDEIISYVGEIKRMFRDELTEGKSVLLEWSYAFMCDEQKNRIGDRYLVFYEARTV